MLVERAQVEALLLLARQNPEVVSMFANITGDDRMVNLARAYDESFAVNRTSYLQFTGALDEPTGTRR